MIASQRLWDRPTDSHRSHWTLPILAALCVIIAAILVTGVALAGERELKPAPAATLIHPSRAISVLWNGDMSVTPVGGWSPLSQPGEGRSYPTALSSLNLFDAFLDSDGPCPGGGGQSDTFCYRWYLGPAYVNPFTVGEMDAVKDAAADHIEFAFTIGRTPDHAYVAILTGESPDYGCGGYTLSSGIVFDLGPLEDGAYTVDSVLDDPDMFLLSYRQGAIGGIIAEDFIDTDGDGQPDTLVLAKVAQFILYGNKGVDEDNGPFDLAGSHGPIQWDDDNPIDGHHGQNECYNYAYGLCPDPLHWMVGLGDCGNSVTCPSDTCNGHETLTARVNSSGCGCKVKAILKHGDPGATYGFAMPSGECIPAKASDRGKAVAKECPSAGGKVEVQDCTLSADVVCP